MSRETLPGFGSERTVKVWEARPFSQAQPASVDPVLRAVAASLLTRQPQNVGRGWTSPKAPRDIEGVQGTCISGGDPRPQTTH